MFKDLKTTEQVFIRHDGPKTQLQMPYYGPFPVVQRNDKTFVVRMHGKEQIVTMDWVNSRQQGKREAEWEDTDSWEARRDKDEK